MAVNLEQELREKNQRIRKLEDQLAKFFDDIGLVMHKEWGDFEVRVMKALEQIRSDARNATLEEVVSDMRNDTETDYANWREYSAYWQNRVRQMKEEV